MHAYLRTTDVRAGASGLRLVALFLLRWVKISGDLVARRNGKETTFLTINDIKHRINWEVIRRIGFLINQTAAAPRPPRTVVPGVVGYSLATMLLNLLRSVLVS